MHPHLGLPRLRRSIGLLLAALLTFGTLIMYGLSPSAKAEGQDDHPVPVIIILEDKPALASLTADDLASGKRVSKATRAMLGEARKEVTAGQHRLLEALKTARIDTQPSASFTDLINGMAMTVDRDQIDGLRRLPGVQSVVTDQQARSATVDSVPLVGAPEVWKQHDAEDRAIRGEGSIVAVIDTGVDYNHPDLGRGLGAGHKVIDGHDFVNGDNDPMDDNGHGTHVTGIIAADGKIQGVAPDASITAYKVLDRNGNGYESDVVAALEAAVDLANPNRADIINISLSTAGDGTDPLGQAATRAVQLGAVVVAAAGDGGPGAHTMTSPAVASGVISVGASTSGVGLPRATMTSPTNLKLQTFRAPFTARPSEPASGELVDVGDGTEADYDRVGSVEGKVVAYRSSLPTAVKYVKPYMLEMAKRAEDRGAIAVLAYGGGGGPVFAPEQIAQSASTAGSAGDVQQSGIVDVTANAIGHDDPQRMERIVVLGLHDLQWDEVQRHLSNGPVMIKIDDEDISDRVASFSAQGPTHDYAVGPDLVAPGFEILSTLPTSQSESGTYRLSGTSGAAPHVAGAAALLRQQTPDASGADLSARLIGSAKGLDDVGPTAQGAGRLDVDAAARTPVFAEPTALSYGLADLDASTVREKKTLKLHNAGGRPQAYNLSTVEAPESVGRATVTPRRVSIPAGGDATVSVTLSGTVTPGDHDISGWVVAEPATAGQPNVRVPYLLAERPLIIQASPDPSDGTSSAYVWTPAPLDQPPTLTMTPPNGPDQRIPMVLDHGTWYRADLKGAKNGTYRLSASAATTQGLRLRGAGAFEVVANQTGDRQWEPVGPNNASGPMTRSPADPKLIAVSQYQKLGPWISKDSGATWTQSSVWPVGGGAGELVIDPRNADVMWYGVMAGDADPTYSGKILRTEDGGATWQTLDVPDVQILDLVGDDQGRALVAVTAETLLVSRDGGDSWATYANPAGADLLDVAIGGDDLFLAGRSSVWSVPDLINGEPGTPKRIYQEPVQGMVADDEIVAILTQDHRVISSSDGKDWTTKFSVPEKSTQSIVMHDGEIMVNTLGDNQWLGHDHGAEWTAAAEPINGSVEDDFTRLDPSTLLWSSPGGGLFRTANDGSQPQRIGVQGETVHDLAISESATGAQLLAGTRAAEYGTDLPTAATVTPEMPEWGLSGSEAYVGRTVPEIETSPTDPATVWKIQRDAVGRFTLQRSADGGEKWQRRGQTTEVPYDLALGGEASERVIVPFNMLEGHGLYLTRDAGETWRKTFHDHLFTTVVTDPTDPDRLWLGGPDGLFRSDDFGETVHQVRDKATTSILLDGQNLVVGGAEIAISDDGGETFTVADSGGLVLQVSDLASSPDDPGTIFAGTTAFTANGLPKNGRGVLKSTDHGRTWENVSGGLQNLKITSLVISSDGAWLYAGTMQGGVHRLALR